MPKSSGLTVAVARDSRQQGEPSDTSATQPDVTANGSQHENGNRTARDTTPAIAPKSPTSPRIKNFFASNAAPRREPTPDRQMPVRRKMVPSASTNDVTAPSTGRPYRVGQNAPIASASHGNLMETGSVTSAMTAGSYRSETDSKMNSSSHHESDGVGPRPSKQKAIATMLSRKASISGRDKDDQRSRSRGDGRQNTPLGRDNNNNNNNNRQFASNSAKTAPLSPEPGFRDALAAESRSNIRNRSADRYAVDSEDERSLPAKPSSSSSQSGSFFSTFMHSSTRAADGIGKAGKGFFGKFARSGSSSHDREVIPVEHYVFRVINLPLIEQTRVTRIRKAMDQAKDKTEFWMPALPYRCIDYLNHHGVEVEGLYRVPGSGREVKLWQIKFDAGPDYDIDLLDENIELYDINVVGSMLKAWLRDLPEELFPKSTQARIQAECEGAKEAPQMLRDELSKLPPYNYYLLFAITCHISLLHSHSDKNKMTYHNLCICFQPCISIDAFCFQFLVCDWRNCWQGCSTEQEYLREEMAAARETRRGTPGLGGPTQQRLGTAASQASLRVENRSREGSRSPERRPPPAPPNSAGNDMDNRVASPYRHENGHNRTSTPPALDPVKPISPMKM